MSLLPGHVACQWACADGGGAAPAAAPLIDPQSIERLRELDPGGVQGVFERVLRAYEASLTRHLGDIGAAHAAADLDRLVRAAHTLKSSSAAVGALAFAQRCAEVEHEVRTAGTLPARAGIEALVHEGQQVRAAVGAMLAQ